MAFHSYARNGSVQFHCSEQIIGVCSHLFNPSAVGRVYDLFKHGTAQTGDNSLISGTTQYWSRSHNTNTNPINVYCIISHRKQPSQYVPYKRPIHNPVFYSLFFLRMHSWYLYGIHSQKQSAHCAVDITPQVVPCWLGSWLNCNLWLVLGQWNKLAFRLRTENHLGQLHLNTQVFPAFIQPIQLNIESWLRWWYTVGWPISFESVGFPRHMEKYNFYHSILDLYVMICPHLGFHEQFARGPLAIMDYNMRCVIQYGDRQHALIGK